MDRGKTGMVLLAGNSHPGLAKEIAKHLGIDVGACVVSHNSNRETIVDIKESVRGKDVYLLQTAASNVNDVVMELLIMAYACKTSNCKNIIGVLPCLPYSQQTKMKRRGNISLKLIADMCVKAGFSHIITVDLHSKESLGFFSCRMDNLRTSPFFLNYIVESIPNYLQTVIVAKSPLAARRASSLADRLGVCIAVLHGENKEDERMDDDGRASPPPNEEQQSVVDQNRIYTVGSSLPPMTAKEKPPMYLAGDVKDKVAILIDDIIDDVKPIMAAARILKDKGATKVYAMATHGVLSNDAPNIVEMASDIDQIIVTNTIPLDSQKLITNKIQTVDISILIAEAIRRIHNKESMSHLFRDVTGED
eukprot:TRINITY_DN3980_c0_g1_i10.p1 TRINITY_DN3980_c0_g1~~TRINITY_DN3980_c0_g1_i10.p1  ORF type:complete len:375 (-),score=93.20 TRINITY_DN3980_c0_g1_i10:503-1591(-)